MTVPVQTPRNQVPITTNQVLLPWTWNLQDEDELVVEVQRVSDGSIVLLTLNTDYTVAAAGLNNNNGGNITIIGSEAPTTNGDIYTMTRNSALDRSPDFATSGAFLAVTANGQLDELTRMTQDQQLTIDATVQKNPGVGDTLDPLIPQMIDKKGLKFVETSPGNFEFQMTEEDVDGALDILTTKGDLLVHNVTVATRLPVGTNGLVVVANSANANGLNWAQVDTAGIANDSITSAQILGGNVTLAKIASNAVGTTQIVDAAVTTVKILDSNVTTAKIADSNITLAKMADNSVDTAELVDDAVTSAKLAADTAVTVVAADKVVIKDVSDADNLKTVTAQSIANLAAGAGSFRGALVYFSGTQNIVTSTFTALDWDTEDYDTDAIHDNVTNNSRLTVPGGVTRIQLFGQIKWNANGTGYRIAMMQKNGADFIGMGENTQQPTSSGNTTNVLITPTISVVATDYFEVEVWQNSGGNLAVNGDSGRGTWFGMRIIA